MRARCLSKTSIPIVAKPATISESALDDHNLRMRDPIANAIQNLVQSEVASAVERVRAEMLAEIRDASVSMRHECGCFEPTWTTKQAAEFLGIARSTLYNEISKGTFPRPRKQGRINAFVPSEVAEVRRVRLGLAE